MEQGIFIIDMATCTGCQTCRIACHDRADSADGVEPLRIETEESGVYPIPTLAYRVVHCHHCAEPSCAAVCPVEAISRDAAGWVLIDAAACTGCGACADACPFGVITLGDDDVAVKCDGCHDEVARGWEPTCVRACPMRALHFEIPPAEVPKNRIADPCFDGQGIEPRVVYLRWRRDETAGPATQRREGAKG